MKWMLTGERVLDRDRHELFRSIVDRIRSEAEPGADPVRARPYDRIEIDVRDKDLPDARVLLTLETLDAASTRLHAKATFHIGFGWWLVLKLFGGRFGLDEEQLVDRLIDEIVSAHAPERSEP